MKSAAVFLFVVSILEDASEVFSFAFAPVKLRRKTRAFVTPPGGVDQDGAFFGRVTPSLEGTSVGDDAEFNPGEPFFQMQQIPTATSGTMLEHMVDCAENGECDVEEMTRMIDELERLNLECEDALSRECSLDAVAARNVLKVALASKVAMKDFNEKQQGASDEECEFTAAADDNPFFQMHQMNDECVEDMHQMPTASANQLERIVQCAEDGDCPVGEISDMIDELERLNMECEGTLSRECSLDAVQARNILKVSLASQAAVARDVIGRSTQS